MKISDYIVEYFSEKGVNHFFGYQGTMISHLVDSIYMNKSVENHSCYNEQGAAFAAVGYAKATEKVAVAYATSGPGAINLLSGIADAYYDSAPVVFIVGQLNTYEYTGIKGIRQNGFQETDIISIAAPIVKYCEKVERKENIRFVLEKSFYMATEGRKGPVLIDLPMNIQREQVEIEKLQGFEDFKKVENSEKYIEEVAKDILSELKNSESPVILLGNGIAHGSDAHKDILSIARKMNIPVITSMLGKDLLESDDSINYGYIGGGYGLRYANFIACKKADLIVSLGCSLCKRQTTMNTEKFAENAQIIRVDIDPKELLRKVHKNEKSYLMDCSLIINSMMKYSLKYYFDHSGWLKKCKQIKEQLVEFDINSKVRKPNTFLSLLSKYIGEENVICVDVGQHQIWTAQSFDIKKGQKMLFSGGHGAMGFALPACIGAYYGIKKRTCVICGDGALQMNIQELQWVFREQIPVTIIVLNNFSLGLIQQQQDDMFDGNYFASTEKGGYTAPDFQKIGEAYRIKSYKVSTLNEFETVLKSINNMEPILIEIILSEKSRAFPKTFFGEEMYNQRPYIPVDIMEKLLEL